VLARRTYDDFKVRSDPHSPVDIKAKTKSPIDVVVRRHDYLPGSTTGWHTHPGPVFITVTQGELTYYLYDDPTFTPQKVRAGQGVVDDGRGHIVRNESGQPAQDVSVIIAPVGAAASSTLPTGSAVLSRNGARRGAGTRRLPRAAMPQTDNGRSWSGWCFAPPIARKR
jgi:oxalate decarboxylase/phosphoglucose isomerase-like protein (cupin superfamily)